MSLINLALNIAWLVLGGFVAAARWLLASLIMAVTIVGIPWARSAFNIAAYTLLPFGSRAVPRSDLDRPDDLGTGWVGTVGNLVWLLFAGWWFELLPVSWTPGLGVMMGPEVADGSTEFQPGVQARGGTIGSRSRGVCRAGGA